MSPSFERYAASICVAIAMLTGCGGAQPGAMPQAGAIATHADRGKSWMLLGAKTIKRLLYLSDGSDAVYVYDYATGKQVGELTGLDGTQGECVDAKGDVYIANFTGGNVVEYARGGTQPIETYSTNGNAIGCAVDKQNDLAAANLWVTSSANAGEICLWKHGKGKPTCYTGSGSMFLRLSARLRR
jgi:hypothetical protein